MAPSAVGNGHGTAHKQRTPLRAGIYSPTMTFFDPKTEDLDIPTIKRHAVRLAEAGLVGLVVMGSNGEAVHLSLAEKQLVTRATRDALDEAGHTDVPVIVGASENSIRGTVALCTELADAGGEYALLVPPSYYRYAMDEEAIYEYFMGVADASPVPVILYNYPGAVAGIDMDSDLMIRLAAHPNIVGTKFTCGNTGKLTRVALATDAVTPNTVGSRYMAFGGMADFTAQTAVSGGSGIIAGGANVLPKTCVKVWELCRDGKYEEAFALQKVLSKGDWVLTKAAIPGTKSAIESYYGYGGYPRKPLKRLGKDGVEKVRKGIEEVMKVEMSL
ncbi:dihydrodipicolinate synthetase-like protein [Pseudovirgaria hyperparasitica]|uniref:Dihydrodipicolinate synthetase-like protein n=1 Tax=Pseudovirgaria hyperparasitica TaxID=470096 RepID=A0A6A6W6M5_9PEZI|nr:dihydrodipicolinate synthetase-like protein [Pseudovirgaria hyperparasitica]KAF2757849.1 dihydrodipicolinate synthetase-like protein [Pseudovirgaria hyperparasitica]